MNLIKAFLWQQTLVGRVPVRPFSPSPTRSATHFKILPILSSQLRNLRNTPTLWPTSIFLALPCIRLIRRTRDSQTYPARGQCATVVRADMPRCMHCTPQTTPPLHLSHQCLPQTFYASKELQRIAVGSWTLLAFVAIGLDSQTGLHNKRNAFSALNSLKRR